MVDTIDYEKKFENTILNIGKIDKSTGKKFYKSTITNGNSFNDFYNKYFNKLVWKIQKMNINKIDAEGIANDTFIHAIDKIEQYKPDTAYSTWLFHIGYNKARQFKNSLKKVEFVDIYDAINEDDNLDYFVFNFIKDDHDDNLDYYNEYMEKYKDTYRELCKMDDKFKQIIELCDIHGYSYNDISSKLDINLQTVKNRLFHGRNKLEDAMIKKGYKINNRK